MVVQEQAVGTEAATLVGWGRSLPLNPYPGLRPFEAEHKPFFFGRDRQIRDIVERIEANHFAAILGGSGCGKSSLILAGVLPTLVQSSTGTWRTVTFRPESSPIANLAAGFHQLLDESAAGAPSVAELTRLLCQRDGLADLVRTFRAFGRVEGNNQRIRDRASLLVVIDQFEEIFREQNKGSVEVDALVNLILDVFENPHPNVFVVLTMRSEDLHGCAAFLGLPEALNRSSYLVPRLRDTQLKEVIVEPALMYAYRKRTEQCAASDLPEDVEIEFDPAVWEEIIEETLPIKNDPDHLPLLQHLLFHVWIAALELEGKAPGAVPRRIDRRALERAVRPTPVTNQPDALLTRAFDSRCEDLFQSLSSEDQRVARQMFTMMGTVDAHGVYKRNFTSTAEIRAATQASDASISRVIETFSQPHPYIRRGQESLDVAHEAFIRKWDRLGQWITEDCQRAHAFRTIFQRYSEWQHVFDTSGRHPWLRKLDAWIELPAAIELRRMGHWRLAGASPTDFQRWMQQAPVRGADGDAPVELSETAIAKFKRFLRLSFRKASLGRVSLAMMLILLLAFGGYAYYNEALIPLLKRQSSLARVESTINDSMNTLYSQVTAPWGTRLGAFFEIRGASRQLQRLLLQPPNIIGTEQHSAFLTVEGKAEERVFDVMTGTLSQYLWYSNGGEPFTALQPGNTGTCLLDKNVSLPGTLVTAADGQRIFLHAATVYSAPIDPGAGGCQIGQKLTQFPDGTQVRVDADLNVLVARIPAGRQNREQWQFLLFQRSREQQPSQQTDEQQPARILLGLPDAAALQILGNDGALGQDWDVRYRRAGDRSFLVQVSDGSKVQSFTGLDLNISKVPDDRFRWDTDDAQWHWIQNFGYDTAHCGLPRPHDAQSYCVRLSKTPCGQRAPSSSKCLRFFIRLPDSGRKNVLTEQPIATMVYELDDPTDLAVGKGKHAGEFRLKTRGGQNYVGFWTVEALQPIMDRVLDSWASSCERWREVESAVGLRYLTMLELNKEQDWLTMGRLGSPVDLPADHPAEERRTRCSTPASHLLN